jgi:hypothetical protein
MPGDEELTDDEAFILAHADDPTITPEEEDAILRDRPPEADPDDAN